MKSNNKYFIFVIFIFILFPSSVKASEKIDIECTDTGGYTKCQVIGKSNYEISALEYRFSLSDGIKKVKFEVDESWEGTEEDNLVLIYTDKNKNGTFIIGTLILESKKKITSKDIMLETLIFYDADFQQHVITNVNKEEKSANNEKTCNNKIWYCVIISIGIIILCVVVRTVKKGALL